MKKVDANQKLIVSLLRTMGCSVAVTSSLGRGFPDLVVGYRNKNYLIELKDGFKPPSQRRLTPDEINFHSLWRGQIVVCKDIDEIIELLS